jgi:hypothetical protein
MIYDVLPRHIQPRFPGPEWQARFPEHEVIWSQVPRWITSRLSPAPSVHDVRIIEFWVSQPNAQDTIGPVGEFKFQRWYAWEDLFEQILDVLICQRAATPEPRKTNEKENL